MLKQFYIVIQIVVAAEKQEWVRLAYVVNGEFGSERGERNAMGIVL
jgi:hypothetical protein